MENNEKESSNNKHGEVFNGVIIFCLVGFLGFFVSMFTGIHHVGLTAGLISGFATWWFKPLSDRFSSWVDSSSNNNHSANKDHEVIHTKAVVSDPAENISVSKKEIKKQAKQKEKDSKALAQQIVLEQQKAEAKKKKHISKKVPHCPKCKSTNIQILDNKRHAFSLTKGIIGGSIAGFNGSHGKKYRSVCMDCGRRFMIKY
ncbi:hypothetical protein OXT66_03040 [Lentilactobacillus senioris]|uniref:hypothetical protein n=1 Tax=Lentilactobacillus senioris TaxID=931534 RepID=UPI002281DC3E|nr:hypothetical protein [Lentilactobacillus senioris]MCY9806524.1 hypothetical protein [Lentilactobacillus senioris]